MGESNNEVRPPFLCSLTQQRFLFKNSFISLLGLAGESGQPASLLPHGRQLHGPRGGAGPQGSSDPLRAIRLPAGQRDGSIPGAEGGDDRTWIRLAMSYPCPMLAEGLRTRGKDLLKNKAARG